MTYQEAEYLIFSQLPFFQRDGDKALKVGLQNITLLCERLGNPQRSFKSVHVAGTNGKGSTSHFLSSIFQEAGYKTGLYTSPHLKDYRERFRINGRVIDKEIVAEFVSLLAPDIAEINPTFFEVTVALSFYWFARERVDVAIIEVGLGGRLDSTNIIRPVLSIITSISYDHQAVLGNTLDKIAFEKAGIIKQNVPVVIGEERRETLPVFVKRAKEYGAPLFRSASLRTDSLTFDQLLRGNFQYKTGFIKIVSPLNGYYQVGNIKAVLKSCEALSGIFRISEEHIVTGISKVVINSSLKGRWQVVGTEPLVICDTGHNEAAWAHLVQQLKNFRAPHYHFILGFSKDKDYNKLLGWLPLPNTLYMCSFDSTRSLVESDVAGRVDYKHFYTNVNEAIASVIKLSDKQDVIFVGGSTYLVAEIEQL